MPRTNVCSEVTIANIRLAVRQVVADFCASPERTIENIVNGQFEHLVEPIQRLVGAHLERIYEQLQCIILSPSDEPPIFESLLRFLSEHNDESEKDIVQRFEKDNILSRGHIRGDWQKFRTRSPMPINPASATVPRLENLMSSNSSRHNTGDKHRKSIKNAQNSNSFSSSKSTNSTMSSASNGSSVLSDSLLQPIQGNENNSQELVVSERKPDIISPCSVAERSPQHMKSDRDANLNDEILVEIRKTANNTLPVVLEKEFIPSVPSAEKEATIYLTLANKKSNKPTSLCSSLRSDDDKVTVRYVPEKIPTTDAAVSTDPIFTNNQSVEKTEVGVNTVIEMAGSTGDGSSSSNTASDNSAGQLPKRLYDTVLQRPSLRIVSLRPDGSIVPIDNTTQYFPSVREWTPETSEENAEKSASEEACDVAGESDQSHSEYNDLKKLDSISASTSRPDPFEEDLNTLANISPLPHS